jgi:hypothetical protein
MKMRDNFSMVPPGSLAPLFVQVGQNNNVCGINTAAQRREGQTIGRQKKSIVSPV